jgi:hypothetical protein
MAKLEFSPRDVRLLRKEYAFFFQFRIGKREDALFVGPPGSGKSHCAQAIGHAVIQQGYRVLYREAHALLEDLADAALDGKRKELMEQLTSVPLLIIDDLGMRKLPLTTTTDAIVAQDFSAAAAAPEPSTVLLLSSGIPGLLMVMRRRSSVAWRGASLSKFRQMGTKSLVFRAEIGDAAFRI